METADVLARKLETVWPLLDERARRIMAASEALSLGNGVENSVWKQGLEGAPQVRDGA